MKPNGFTKWIATSLNGDEAVIVLEREVNAMIRRGDEALGALEIAHENLKDQPGADPTLVEMLARTIKGAR